MQNLVKRYVDWAYHLEVVGYMDNTGRGSRSVGEDNTEGDNVRLWMLWLGYMMVTGLEELSLPNAGYRDMFLEQKLFVVTSQR